MLLVTNDLVRNVLILGENKASRRWFSKGVPIEQWHLPPPPTQGVLEQPSSTYPNRSVIVVFHNPIVCEIEHNLTVLVHPVEIEAAHLNDSGSDPIVLARSDPLRAIQRSHAYGLIFDAGDSVAYNRLWSNWAERIRVWESDSNSKLTVADRRPFVFVVCVWGRAPTLKERREIQLRIEIDIYSRFLSCDFLAFQVYGDTERIECWNGIARQLACQYRSIGTEIH